MSVNLFVFKQNDNQKANVMEEEAHSQNSTAAGVKFCGDVTLVDEFKIWRPTQFPDLNQTEMYYTPSNNSWHVNK